VISAPPAALAPAPAPTVTAPNPGRFAEGTSLPKPTPAVTPLTPAPKPTAGLTPAPGVPTIAFPFLPFVALNALFDAACGLLGPFGRVLKSGFCKQLYGLAGLVLLIYTVAHIAQLRQWITLPVQLPWPPTPGR
jgi:hypothetical protein